MKTNAALEVSRTASMRRMVMLGLGAFIALLMAGAIALWLTLGSTVFYELLVAGIAYCF
jgi:sulfite exporter TauE/SafE